MSIANIRAFCSFLLPRHRPTNPQIELVASIAPPLLAATALAIFERRDASFLSTLFSIRDVSQSAQAALLVTSGILMAGSLLRREIALFTQSSYNTLAMFAASYASVSIINAYAKGQDLPSLVLVTGFIAFSALLNTSLYLYSNREKFSSTFNFSDPFNALRQLNSLIKDPTLSDSHRNAFVEARKGLIHRIFSYPELFHTSLIEAGHTSEEAKSSAVVGCNPGPLDPDKPLVNFCLNFLFLWFFERQPPRHLVYALRPCRLAYINSLRVCPLEFKVQIDEVKKRFEKLKRELMVAIQGKDRVVMKKILTYLSIEESVVNKILLGSPTAPLGIEDFQRLTFPLPEDWELFYCILQHTPVRSQPDWQQIETLCKRNMPKKEETALGSRRSVSVGSCQGAADSVVPLLGAVRRRRATQSSSILDTPRGGQDGTTTTATAAGALSTPRLRGVPPIAPSSDPLVPPALGSASVGLVTDPLPIPRAPEALPPASSDSSQGGAPQRTPVTPGGTPPGSAAPGNPHVGAAAPLRATALPLVGATAGRSRR